MAECDDHKDAPPAADGERDDACARAARRFLDLWLRQLAVTVASSRDLPRLPPSADIPARHEDRRDEQPE